jgi:hypothetical protein
MFGLKKQLMQRGRESFNYNVVRRHVRIYSIFITRLHLISIIVYVYDCY